MTTLAEEKGSVIPKGSCIHCRTPFDPGDDPDRYTCKPCRKKGHGFLNGQCRKCREEVRVKVNMDDPGRIDPVPKTPGRFRESFRPKFGFQVSFEPPDPPKAA